MLAPTLIIGLGGKGSEIATIVSKMVTEEQRKHIGFVVFDTDVNELRDVKEKHPHVKTVQTSTSLSVGEYLNIDTHARDAWFPVNKILCRKTLTEGAGQVRAISRLALDTAIRTGAIEPLHEAIEELYQIEQEMTTQALRIIIVSSLAGGTGSGLILPVAMYVRNYLQTRFQQSANITRGFFLLPEVFNYVIRGEAERNNLRCNAYASLREIDAFLMKGDGTLPEKYRETLKFEFPRVASDECEEYDVMPFDFCFLFDAQNIHGKKLNNFEQYIHHAANCIYAQSIGPMNKRSNSSEDNIIREICKSGGRNRYAGAGSSMLVYPYKDIREYVAMQWANQSVSDQWLFFDREFKKKSIQNAEMRSKGIMVKDLDPKQDYIDSVQAAAANKNPFALSIQNSCDIFDDESLSRIGNRWIEYMGHLRKHVHHHAMGNQPDLDKKRKTVTRLVSGLGENNENVAYYDAFMKLEEYRKHVERRSEEISRTIAYSLFKSDNDNLLEDKFDYQLETYLVNDKNEFIHPNAVRYFLYQTLDQIELQKKGIQKEVAKKYKYFETFEAKAFDDGDDETVDTALAFANRKQKWLDRTLNRTSEEQELLIEKFGKYQKEVDEFRVELIYLEVLNAGMEYVKNMAESFEVFYKSMEGNIRSIQYNIDNIEHKYDSQKGDTTRYVCASKECLDKFKDNMPFTGTALSISGELSKNIYSRIRKYSMMKNKPNASYFYEIFNQQILGYFRNLVMQSYGTDIKIDIIRAIELEAQYEKGIFDDSEIEIYVKRTIDQTRYLSEPFIEKPLGEQRSTIPACAFNGALYLPDDPERKEMVDSLLRSRGGVVDEDVESNMILFYNAIYGLRANELSKFSPPEENETSNRPAGQYFKSYYELVSQIRPKSEDTPVITPHIDRQWHLISRLPDLDEGNQYLQEKEIFKAFFLGFLFEKVKYKETEDQKKWYRLFLNGTETKDFVVSNQTPCDAYYEVMDALTINRSVVLGIIESVEADIEKQILKNEVNFDNSKFKTHLDELMLTEFSVDQPMSVIDLAVILKASTPVELFREKQGIELMRVIMENLHSYTERLCPKQELRSKFRELILNQFNIFKDNLEWYDETWPSTLSSYMDSILNVVVNFLSMNEYDDVVDVIEGFMKERDKEKLRNK